MGRVRRRDAGGPLLYLGHTGAPKGVLYTHRSNYLHTLRALQADAVALTPEDSVLVAVPMFHANGWGFPFAGPAVGAKLVLPGRHADGAHLARLIWDEGVTIAAGVPAVWQGLLDHLDVHGGDMSSLKRVLVGGSTCPDTLIRRMEDRLRARVQTSWGMTELSPLGTIAAAEEQARRLRPGARHGTGYQAHRCGGRGAGAAKECQRAPQGKGPQRHQQLFQIDRERAGQ